MKRTWKYVKNRERNNKLCKKEKLVNLIIRTRKVERMPKRSERRKYCASTKNRRYEEMQQL